MEKRSIQLTFNNDFAQFINFPASTTTEELRKIKNSLAYFQPGFMHTKLFKMKRWDGRIHLLDRMEDCYQFPTGLLSTFIKACKEHNIAVTAEDRRMAPKLSRRWHRWFGVNPHYYQKDAATQALKSTRGIIELPTGSGKMLFDAWLIHLLGLDTVVIVLSVEALKQTADEIRKSLRVPVAEWGGKSKELGEITVVTMQSMYQKNRTEKLMSHVRKTKVLITDEFHTTGAKEHYEIVRSIPAYYKFGQTGTPFRGDSAEFLLQAACGRVIYRQPVTKLQEEGYLAKSHILFFRAPPPAGMTKHDMVVLGTTEAYDRLIVENKARNDFACELVRKFAEIGPTLVVARIIEHAKYMAEALDAPLITGRQKDRKVRGTAIEDFIAGKINIAVATVVFDQSVNIPNLRVVVSLSGQAPRGRLIQRHGRVIRVKEDGAHAINVDFMDDFENRVHAHSQKRFKYFKQAGHAPILIDGMLSATEIKKRWG